ncbi:aminopeptidase M1-like isoform X2 [Pogonomyrmex barbatus]|uniref:Aminopeptidase M1-like isoform X2 n=1 Tax=Pogonomyrmex barbatus TaxID=144034 RepID=A0A6I9VWW3_9HYME|nr:aminopeptidase M1-like isoform X2 [Pogonomyrmex barbatus]
MWQQPEESLMRNKYAIADLTDDSVNKLQFVLYREEDIIYNEEINSIARKIELSRIIGRKVVGQLFDTAISPSWWSYMWLNEGIATLFGVYIINQT